MFDDSKASRAVKFIELLKLTGDFHGQPFKLIPWQRQIISDVYGTLNKRGVRQYRYAYIECPKKNAKSQLTAAVGCKHLFDKQEPNGQIFLVAGDRNQAESQLYVPLVEMIEQEPSLLKRVKITDSKKHIENKETGTVLRVISAEAYTKHGLNVSCCIFDELHAQPSRDLWDVMTKGAGLARRQPIWWVITTAGDDPDRKSIAWEVHEKAERILEARASNDIRGDIPTWYPVIYSYPGEDIYNEDHWRACNPSLGITLQIEDLRDLAAEARLHPADERLFRWLNLNQWVTTKLSSWLPLDLFDATSWGEEVSRGNLIGAECYVGGDFSTTTDLSATCLVFPPQIWSTPNPDPKGEPIEHQINEWRVFWDCWIPEDNMQERIREDHVPYDQWAAAGWIIPTPGDVIDYNRIEQRFAEYKNLYRIIECPFDFSFAAMLVQRLQQEYSLEVVDIPQRYTTLTDPMNQVEVWLRNAQLIHEPNPVARWCFGNMSISKNGNSQIKYVKEHKGKSIDRTKRIDLIVALVIAAARARFYKINNLDAIMNDEWGM